MLKQKFLLRQSLMKSYGEKGKLMGRIENWIDSHIDEIYDHFRLKNNQKMVESRLQKKLTAVFSELKERSEKKSVS